MSFGNKKLDAAYDRWKTAAPEDEDEDDSDEKIEEQKIEKEVQNEIL